MLELSHILSFYPEHLRSFRKNLLREYLQYKILEVISDSVLGVKLAFMKGTCIHLVHSNPRFSEDLDFDNLELSRDEFVKLSEIIKKALERQGFRVDLRTKLGRAFRAYLRFRNILFESGLSGHKEEKLLIQVDAEPQQFDYRPDRFILNKFDVFLGVRTVPADILLAQKIFCIFNRKRAMGRDFYDAVFLMGKTQANMNYLRMKAGITDSDDLRMKLLNRCEQLDFDHLSEDVEAFLFYKNDVKKVKMFPEYMNAIF